ncbi:TetR/AcrR family transcriptional regulator [Geomicrobium sp. JCM 19038]|uniref:TetR/AcrR family transcriptional regulator n=1 Tax=Geomicrobium sp. JCM 19038 TaxID=1460635 RepID=UPI00045F2DA0|nr:TetR/AcrR family transcriptional regulator [Geomicrobium sp. JCM 19038]GAK08263.1 transcriptional regulator, TetR family [Geomicrobium sp. JCM 19038]
MDKKNIKRRRMWKYFIEATAEIIEDEGYDNITIRKIADKAGYNSATIYNYFSELSHLIFFASMRFMKPYTTSFLEAIKKDDTAIGQYLLGWECFCDYSYREPRLFHTVFMMNIGREPQDLFEQYYDLYEADIIDFPETLKPALYERNVATRGEVLLEAAAKEGHIHKDHIEAMTQMTTLIWQGMLMNILNQRTKMTAEEAKHETMIYIRNVINQSHHFEG